MSAYPPLAALGLWDYNHLGQNDNLMLWEGHVVVLQSLTHRFPRPCFWTFAPQFHLDEGDRKHAASLASSVHLALLMIPLKEGSASKQEISLK